MTSMGVAGPSISFDGLLFHYFEYVGDDYEADMTKMAAHPKTQQW